MGCGSASGPGGRKGSLLTVEDEVNVSAFDRAGPDSLQVLRTRLGTGRLR